MTKVSPGNLVAISVCECVFVCACHHHSLHDVGPTTHSTLHQAFALCPVMPEDNSGREAGLADGINMTNLLMSRIRFNLREDPLTILISSVYLGKGLA